MTIRSKYICDTCDKEIAEDEAILEIATRLLNTIDERAIYTHHHVDCARKEFIEKHDERFTESFS